MLHSQDPHKEMFTFNIYKFNSNVEQWSTDGPVFIIIKNGFPLKYCWDIKGKTLKAKPVEDSIVKGPDEKHISISICFVQEVSCCLTCSLRNDWISYYLSPLNPHTHTHTHTHTPLPSPTPDLSPSMPFENPWYTTLSHLCLHLCGAFLLFCL